MTTKTQTQQNTEHLDEMFEIADGSNTEFTDVFPTIQWFHGNKQIPSGIGRTGGFFIESKKYPSFSAKGWTEQTIITRDGTELHGFGTQQTEIAVIRMKSQWIKDEQGKNVPLRQALVVVKDVDDIFVISLKGASKAIAFEKAFNDHRSQIVATANRARPAGKNPIEPFALWFSVKAAEVSKITSKHNPKSSSDVTAPVLNAPTKIELPYIRTLFVGKENYLKFGQIFKDTAAWQKQPIMRGDHPEDNGIDTVSDAQLKEMLDLCTIKDQDERELALTVSDGETETLEMLNVAQYRQAMELLRHS